jgi:pyridoxal 5'-phosphate synthase pdxS subunit
MELEKLRHGTELIKRGFASMQKGGVVMDVTTPQQAKIAEEAGAVAVMALQAVPADIRREGGVARMADPQIISQIIDTVTIPVMAKARIGHFVEAEILQALGVDMVDESEVLTPADEKYHIDKTEFTVPFVCGARNLGEALRRINEGAAMIRTKGEAGTGDVREAVRHMKLITGEIRKLKGLTKEELISVAREIEAPIELVIEAAQLERLPVVNFAAGGVATPADAALMMRLGADGVFVGSGIFKAEKPELMASAIVEAVNNYENPEILADISKGIGTGMKGISIDTILPEQGLQNRGW